jgi:hypothetical protein
MKKESGRVVECQKCGKRLYPPVTFVAPGHFRVNMVFPNTLVHKHLLSDHSQDIDPMVLEYLRRGGPCPKCHTITRGGPEAAAHALKCGLIPWEFKLVRVTLENRQEGNREFVVDPEKNSIVAETQWTEEDAPLEKVSEPQPSIPEEHAPEEEMPEAEEEIQVSSEVAATPQEPQPQPTPQPEVTGPSAPPSTPSTSPKTSNKQPPTSISPTQQTPGTSFGKGRPSQERGEEELEEEEVPMEPTELEGIEWRPVTELVRQYGEHYHIKPRPRPRRRKREYEEYEEELEQVRPKKKRSYLPYVAIGLLAVAAVAYFLHRRQRSPVQPSSGSPLGVPMGITPVAPSVPPTPQSAPEPSASKPPASQGEKPTTTPIVADWTQKLKVI